MRKRLCLLVVPLILVVCSQKVELSSTGMYPNYQVGEMVSLIPVDSLAYEDVIACYSYVPGFQEGAFKRIAGLPGDAIRFQDQQCIVNGKKYGWEFIRKFFYEDDECEEYRERLSNDIKANICKNVVPINSTTATTSAVVVPAGSYFVIGDYRNNSTDSRSQGRIIADLIIGRSTKGSEYLRISLIYHITEQ